MAADMLETCSCSFCCAVRNRYETGHLIPGIKLCIKPAIHNQGVKQCNKSSWFPLAVDILVRKFATRCMCLT